MASEDSHQAMADANHNSWAACANLAASAAARRYCAGLTPALAQSDRGDRHATHAFRLAAAAAAATGKLSGSADAISGTNAERGLVRTSIVAAWVMSRLSLRRSGSTSGASENDSNLNQPVVPKLRSSDQS